MLVLVVMVSCSARVSGERATYWEWFQCEWGECYSGNGFSGSGESAIVGMVSV